MTDTRITRNTLANSFKELMKDNDFSKISVADICRNCNINRKSFYYHFYDIHQLQLTSDILFDIPVVSDSG